MGDVTPGAFATGILLLVELTTLAVVVEVVVGVGLLVNIGKFTATPCEGSVGKTILPGFHGVVVENVVVVVVVVVAVVVVVVVIVVVVNVVVVVIGIGKDVLVVPVASVLVSFTALLEVTAIVVVVVVEVVVVVVVVEVVVVEVVD